MKLVYMDNNTSTETITSYKFIKLGKYDAIKLTTSKLTYMI
jgi:hypothetical protein